MLLAVGKNAIGHPVAVVGKPLAVLPERHSAYAAPRAYGVVVHAETVDVLVPVAVVAVSAQEMHDEVVRRRLVEDVDAAPLVHVARPVGAKASAVVFPEEVVRPLRRLPAEARGRYQYCRDHSPPPCCCTLAVLVLPRSALEKPEERSPIAFEARLSHSNRALP